jgi:hypothetical protein
MASYCPKLQPIDWCEPELHPDWHRAEEPRNEAERKLRLIDELISKTLVYGIGAAVEVPLEQRLREHAAQWDRETAHLSSPLQRMMHPSYQAILGMGAEHKQDVVRFLLRDLQMNHRDWLLALSYLTQVNPIDPQDAGKTDKLANAWLRWGREQGLL